MRILFISSEYPPETGFGGIGTYTRIAARSMSARGHDVTVIAELRRGGTPFAMDDGVAVHRVQPEPFPLPGGRIFYPLRLLSYHAVYQTLVRLSRARAVLKKYRELAAGADFDIIEAPECGAEAHYIRPARARLVIRLHTPWEMIARLDQKDDARTDTAFAGWLEKRVARRAHAVTSPTLALKRILEKRWGLKNVVHYPNPVDLENLPVRTGPGNYIIYTGRVEYRKGVHVLVKAYAELCREGGEIPPLLLVGAPFGAVRGGGEYGALIEEMIRKNRIQDRVQWIRSAAREIVVEKMAGATAAVFPSLWENFPYACLEAMACGVPAIASACGGYPEMISDGVSGLLFRPLDHLDLAGRLRNLLRDPGLSQRLSEGGRARVESAYAAGIVGREAEQFYGSVIHG